MEVKFSIIKAIVVLCFFVGFGAGNPIEGFKKYRASFIDIGEFFCDAHEAWTKQMPDWFKVFTFSTITNFFSRVFVQFMSFVVPLMAMFVPWKNTIILLLLMSAAFAIRMKSKVVHEDNGNR